MREGAKFCDICGAKTKIPPEAPVPPPETIELEQKKYFCDACQGELMENAKFCDSCGLRVAESTENCVIEEESPLPTDTPAVEEPLPQENLPQKKICPQCEKILEPQIKFCDVCGSDVREIGTVGVAETP